MNKDLEELLKEMGPDYRAVVGRLRSSRTVEPRDGGQCCDCAKRKSRRTTLRSTAEWLVAASLLLTFGLSVLLLPSSPSHSSHPSCIPREYRLTPAEMIATQRPDGGWQNDFLTRRNAEALAKCDGLEARIAYKKAMRNLRSKGIL